MTLACADDNSKLVDVVTVADVDDEDQDHVGNSLLHILKLRFGHKAKLLFGNVSILGLIKHFQKGDKFCQLSVIIMFIFLIISACHLGFFFVQDGGSIPAYKS